MSQYRNILSAIAAVFLIVSSAAAQNPVAGRIIVRVTPDAVERMRTLFEPVVSNDPHFDPQRCTLRAESQIRDVFSLPGSVRGLWITPLFAQHNVALESLRERTNPILFSNSKLTTRIAETEALAMLRSSEDRIARCFELHFDPSTSPAAIAVWLRKSGIVEFAEPRFAYATTFVPNDSLLSMQYSIATMHVTQAWDKVRCDSTMLIAVDDIGTDWNHRDLRDAIFVNQGEVGLDSLGYDKRSNGIDDDGDGFVDDWHGWDFAGADGSTSDNDPSTFAEHGTHTGGIMAAEGNNITGICGIAFGARLLPLKCGDDLGGSVAFGYEGIVYAADMGAKIVNNSWGGTGFSQLGQDVVNYATAKNCLVVAAAGNDQTLEDLYPASFNHVLSVCATDQLDGLAYFSSYGRHVDVAAPGQGIVSTIPSDKYRSMDGTSMASPNAAGVAALVRQKFPSLTPDQVAERIRSTARPINLTEQDRQNGFTGHGIVQADSALDLTKPHHSVRIVSVTIDDPDGDGTLQSGEGANIVLSVRNFLDPIEHLTAHIQVLDPTPGTISFTSNDLQFPDANTLDVVQNVSGTLHVNVSPTAGLDLVIPIRVTFSNGTDYQGDIDYFTLVINPSYLDLNKNTITATISARGDVGFNDPPNNEQGSGFTWVGAPPSILASGKTALFDAGLMVATDPDHVVSSAPSAANDLVWDQDFRVLEPSHYILEPDKPGALQEIECRFDDSPADSSLIAQQVGVNVHATAYEFGGAAANAVVLDYVLSHQDALNGIAASDQTAVALYMDWDVGSSGANNVSMISPLDSMLAVTKRLDPGFPFVGVKIISALPDGTSFNLFAMLNDGSDSGIGVFNGYPNANKFTTMTTPQLLSGPGDVSMIYGLRNVPLASMDSVHVTYVFGFGVDDSDLKRTIDNATAAWFGTSSVSQAVASGSLLRCYPNPCEGMLHIESPFDGAQDVRVYDVLGRTVYRSRMTGQQTLVSLPTLDAGAYRLVVSTPTDSRSTQLIVR
ncbi:MAG: S8 family serine peptidase [Bacteroidetes bacterium]|nr:S8 family serine peptidase [Bacteroidota bacterium]